MAANIQKELAGINLGDPRRSQRIRKLAARMAESPSQSLGAACGGWGDAIAAFRLLHNSNVTPDKILDAHLKSTLKRAEACDRLLFIDDTTELDYTSHKALSGVGRLDHSYRQGFYANKDLPFEEKESFRWYEGYLQACDLAAEKTRGAVVYVGDRESDIHELYVEHARRREAGEAVADLVLRTGRDRMLVDEEVSLFAHLRNAPELGGLLLEILTKTRRKKDTPPGAQCLWPGLEKLRHYVEMGQALGAL